MFVFDGSYCAGIKNTEIQMHQMRQSSRRLSTALMLSASLTVFGCTDDPLGPSGQLQVEKAADTFFLEALNLEDGTQLLSYPWDNTGTQATVVIVDGILSGSAILTIEDDAGAVVLQDDIANDNDTDTAVGVSGSWRIEIDIQDVTGNFTVSIWKKP
jgi:hypothetical protein